jgi:uridine monophosphate synthetase
MGFFTRLEERSQQIDSLLCIGLDPHPEELPNCTAKDARDFCFRIIDSTNSNALAYKPNIAFFERFGSQGLAALVDVLNFIPEEIPVILDAKRGDIASTAVAYAEAAFNEFNADAITVNPYLGYDSLEPFLKDPDKGVFLLCKTSNPGASDFQDLQIKTAYFRGLELYEVVAQKAQSWNDLGNLGLVVGATQIESLRRVRQQAPDLWFLAPGVGAQGANLEQALKMGLRKDGKGMLISVSRSISRAESPKQAAMNLKNEINRAKSKLHQRSPKTSDQQVFLSPHLRYIADELIQTGCVKFGEFTLKSGLKSPIYIDLRRLVAYPVLLDAVAKAYLPVLEKLTFDRLAPLPYAALPIGTAISLASEMPMIYPRKETKSYGTKATIEGVFAEGERVVLLDDLATTGGSKIEALEKLTENGLRVRDVVVLIDRESGAASEMAKAGLGFHAVFTLSNLLSKKIAFSKYALCLPLASLSIYTGTTGAPVLIANKASPGLVDAG